MASTRSYRVVLQAALIVAVASSSANSSSQQVPEEIGGHLFQVPDNVGPIDRLSYQTLQEQKKVIGVQTQFIEHLDARIVELEQRVKLLEEKMVKEHE